MTTADEIVSRCDNASVTVAMVVSVLPDDSVRSPERYALGGIEWFASDECGMPAENRLAWIAACALGASLTAEERELLLKAKEMPDGRNNCGDRGVRGR